MRDVALRAYLQMLFERVRFKKLRSGEDAARVWEGAPLEEPHHKGYNFSHMLTFHSHL